MIDCLYRMTLIIDYLEKTAVIIGHPEHDPAEAGPDHDEEGRPPTWS